MDANTRAHAVVHMKKGYSIVTCCLGKCYSQTGIACVLECVRKCTVCICAWMPSTRAHKPFITPVTTPLTILLPTHSITLLSTHPTTLLTTLFTKALISHILITHQSRHLTTLPTTLISILTTHQSTHLTTHLSPQRSFQFSPHTPHHTKRSLLRRNPSPSPHHSIAHVSIPSK